MALPLWRRERREREGGKRRDGGGVQADLPDGAIPVLLTCKCALIKQDLFFLAHTMY